MIKEYKIDDILNAIESISKMKRGKSRFLEINNSIANTDGDLTVNNQAKSNKSEILVLDQMIE